VREGDSHNLGKTTLIALIDFLLLKDITNSENFLDKHKERFKDFVFFMELALHDGGFVTIRRAVGTPTRIGLKRTAASLPDARTVDADAWDHWDIALAPARQALDAYLNLRAITPWEYRTGVSYFLRTQEDYSDYFQIQKFMRGQDRAWKPYLAAVLGLDHGAVLQKYEDEEEISRQTALRDARLAEIDPNNRDRGELATRIEIARDEISEIDARLDGFDFHEVEVQISKRVVDAVEAKIDELGQEIYDLDVDIAQLEHSISAGIKFDLTRIREIFAESEVLFPEAVSHSYEELVDFNKKLTRERNKALRDRLTELQGRRDRAIAEHKGQSDERRRLMAIVREADTFRKYKALQSEQAERRGTLNFLESQLARVDAAADVERLLRDLRNRRDASTTAIEISLERGSPIKAAVTRYFNRFVKQVLGINGEFIVGRNTNGNIEFEIRTKDVAGADTSQDKGHSYHRLLCALFDLAVLKTLETMPFYHFVYHDGILEGLDNRVKLRLLDLIRETIAGGRVQYILSVIDADLPRKIEDEEQIHFGRAEIILALNDQGDDGRLFKMPPF
jgi:uncharacterized protein YydD (DUF2326 family)